MTQADITLVRAALVQLLAQGQQISEHLQAVQEALAQAGESLESIVNFIDRAKSQDSP